MTKKKEKMIKEWCCLQGRHAGPNHPEERFVLLGQQKHCSCPEVADSGPHFQDIIARCFRNINMEIKEGSLIAVVGKVILM